MKMFRNILVPFDIGFVPRLALVTAAALAYEGAELTLLHVTEPVRRLSAAAAFTSISDEDIAVDDARVQRASGDALAILSEYGAAGISFVTHGSSIHRTINRFATEIDADVIVMGTHGRRGLSRALWGSVTEDVLREADVPVIVVRESSDFQPVFEERRNRV